MVRRMQENKLPKKVKKTTREEDHQKDDLLTKKTGTHLKQATMRVKNVINKYTYEYFILFSLKTVKSMMKCM